MRKMNRMNSLSLFGFATSILVSGVPSALAKVKPMTLSTPKSIEVGFIKGIHGEATLTVQKNIQVPPKNGTLQFQDGKVAEEVEFYKSPRCYLHFKKDSPEARELPIGQNLKVSKIDNVYSKGSVHVTFWFDNDPSISDLSCITNYNHTLTVDELKATLGNLVTVNLTKSVETGALFNTAPVKNAKVLSEDSTRNNFPVNSARVILQGS